MNRLDSVENYDMSDDEKTRMLSEETKIEWNFHQVKRMKKLNEREKSGIGKFRLA